MAKKPEIRKDPGDGMPALGVGEWAKEKHERLKRYITATSGVRNKFTKGPGGSAFVDMYCGPGRCFIKGTDTFLDGSPLIAQNAARNTGVPFTHFVINDVKESYVGACEKRLLGLGMDTTAIVGTAEASAKAVVAKLPKYAYAVAFIDPFNLVPFKVLQELSEMNRMDLLVHVSIQELQRNLDQYFGVPNSPLEAFAPGINGHLKQGGKKWMRQKVIEYWAQRVSELGMEIGSRIELISGSRNQPLYHLVLISRSDLADNIWSQVAKINGQGELWS